LDAVADRISPLVGRLAPAGAVKDALSGTWLGHPLHPAAVLLPLSCLTSGTLLDRMKVDGDGAAARRLIGAGVLLALPAAASGLSDWSDTTEAERRVGVVHAAANAVALGLYGLSWVRRRRGRGRLSALSGAGALALSGWLGGHLAYAQGVGVDTTAFESGPQEWTPVADEADVHDGELTEVTSGDMSLLLTGRDGRVLALANRCTHRGAPLTDGSVEDGCVVCPWHGSRFDLQTGEVMGGPATRPQPRFETRVVDGKVEVRRQEVRSLRTNPV
jgi:nitrite reductase/ring-hydroxylating ferredoxin subunit/uncharacterized membrane protein